MKRPNRIFLWIIGIASFLCCIVFILWPVIGVVAIVREDMMPFYKNLGPYDTKFLPLIEPYRAAYILGDTNVNGWEIDLLVSPDEKEIYYYLDIKNVTKIAVEKGVIMAYSPDSLSSTEYNQLSMGQNKLFWFVIIPSQRIETGFETEAEFLNYVRPLGIDQPLWVDPEVVYKQFAKTRCLDWIPGCK